MPIEGLIIWLVIGAIAGWLAGMLVRGYGFGLIGNILVGIAGAIIAGWLLAHVGFFLVGGILAEIVNAVIGAVDSLACDRSRQTGSLKLIAGAASRARPSSARTRTASVRSGA
jgi:uncharacterized membrane protein YeaQ/YmgE (transglycosylase-associated protein family)